MLGRDGWCDLDDGRSVWVGMKHWGKVDDMEGGDNGGVDSVVWMIQRARVS